MINTLKMDSKEHIMWKEIFFKDNFSVDQCLAKYTQKADLETLRKELKDYAVELHQQMSEILKAETETIVNLAEYLTNLNTKIENLSVPVSQLQEEIKTLYNMIKEAEGAFKKSLNDLKYISSEKDNLELKFDLITSCINVNRMMRDDLSQDLTLLERAVNTYSSKRNYLEELGELTSDIKVNINEVGDSLVQTLNERFLSAVECNNESLINRCLHMYDNLNRHSEAEHIFQVNVVRPGLRNIICETNLARHNQNLDAVHQEVLNFMDTRMTTVVHIIERHPELKSFDFVQRSFWPEVDKQSREGLPHITAPGNPDLFQKRFISSWNLVKDIAKRCGNPDLVRKNETFQNYIKRFNLPVYFEIRFQQIAGNYEKIMLMKPGKDIYNKPGPFRLKVSSGLHAALLNCFGNHVFLEHLGDQFLKLSLLLLARYYKWFDTALENYSSSKYDLDWETFIMSSIADLLLWKNYIGIPSETETNDIVDKQINDKAIQMSEEMKDEAVVKSLYTVMPLSAKSIIFKALVMNSKLINEKVIKLKQHIQRLKIDNCLANLQNVGAIPRLYRRTNRSAPKNASNYIVETVTVIVNFNYQFSSMLGNKFRPIMDAIIVEITEEYLKLVQQVLSSVCKTEESLRRLKSKTMGTTEDSTQNSDTMSDEMKIREQIKLDVLLFVDQLYSLGGDQGRKAMDLLKQAAGCD